MTQSLGDGNSWNQQNHLVLNCVTQICLAAVKAFQKDLQLFSQERILIKALQLEVLRSTKLRNEEIGSNQKRMPRCQGLKGT